MMSQRVGKKMLRVLIQGSFVSMVLISTSLFAAERMYSSPTVNGLFIDQCVQGAGWHLLDQSRCDRTRKQAVADAFCKTKNYTRAQRYKVRTHLGNHAVLTFKKNSSPGSGKFTQVAGSDRLDDIVCFKPSGSGSTDARRKEFANPTIAGLRVDRCVQGAGWGLIDPRRCDQSRQKVAASAYCRSKGYTTAEVWRHGTHVGNHSVWSFPRRGISSDGAFTQVAGGDAFTRIACGK